MKPPLLPKEKTQLLSMWKAVKDSPSYNNIPQKAVDESINDFIEIALIALAEEQYVSNQVAYLIFYKEELGLSFEDYQKLLGAIGSIIRTKLQSKLIQHLFK